MFKGLSGNLNPHWKGGRNINRYGYVEIKNWDHPRSSKRGYVFEHILVYEQYYNCCVLPYGDIHHKNEIKTDNRIENLELLSPLQHKRKHAVDMTNRKCCVCGSTKTYMMKLKNCLWPHWYNVDKKLGLFKCHNCGAREAMRKRSLTISKQSFP